MDNFQYSVQLSDQDWAEFSATADECGLLQAGLASGDELLSSDIDQGDSSGSSPPGPPPRLTGQLVPRGRGWRGCEEDVTTKQLFSRSQCEAAQALGAGQQAAGTSTGSEALPSPGSESAPPGRCSPLPGAAASRDEMQRLLQGPAPSPPGGPSKSPEAPDCAVTPQRLPDSPGAPSRSPGRKKRRAVGPKGRGCSGPSGPAAPLPGPLLLAEVQPEESLVVGTAKLMTGTQQVNREPDPAGASEPSSSPPEQVARRGLGSDPSTPVPTTEQGTDQTRTTPSAELHTAATPVQEAHPDVNTAKPDVALSTPACKPQPNLALSTPAPKPDVALSTPASKPHLHKASSSSASTPRLHVDLPTEGLGVQTEVDPSRPMPCATLLHSASEAESDVGVSTPVPSLPPDSCAEAAAVDTEVVVSLGGHQEKLRGEPSAGLPECPLGELPPGPAQAPKRKKVRFCVAVPSSEEPHSGETTGSPLPATAQPPAPRTTAGGRGGSAAWDAVAVGPRAPQPRILKHLPPPAPSASSGLEPGSGFAVTLPEAYEFFFCDTIEEEDEGAEDEAVASQALGEVQWPDTCEFFFRDYQAPRLRHRGARSLASHPRAEPEPAAPTGDPVPISIPEAYEHFLGEDELGSVLPPASLPQLQNLEPLEEVRPGAAPEPRPAMAQQLSLAVRRAGELQGPLSSLTFSQNDMCLVFVAFASWAVRTSDLSAPDAWKTVLLANIGTISAIRYFRRQAGRGSSPSSSPSPSPSPGC